MMLFKFLLGLVLLLNTVPSIASDQSAKKEKLLRLAQYEEVVEVARRYRTLCISEMNKITPFQMVKDNPDYFGGIEPGSKYWPEIEKIYSKYIESGCSYLDEQQVLNEFVKIYSEDMSDTALDGILHFYESRAGAEYLKAISAGKERLQEYYAKAAPPAIEKAMKTYNDDLKELIRKCHRKENNVQT